MSKKQVVGKYELEINFPGNGRCFVNFWDWAHGNDVVAELVGGELEIGGKPISFDQYLDKVKESIQKRTV